MTGPPAPPRSSTGLDENLAAALSYVGGAVTGVLFLALEQRSAVVRFHARQSAITFLVLAVAYLLIHSLPVVGRFLGVFRVDGNHRAVGERPALQVAVHRRLGRRKTIGSPQPIESTDGDHRGRGVG